MLLKGVKNLLMLQTILHADISTIDMCIF